MLTADYKFYTETYHGKMEQTEFDRMAVLSSAYLDELTMGRTSGTLTVDVEERAKLAFCSVADAYLLNEQGGGIASETNDGVSVTYVAGISNSKSEGRRLYEAAALFLGPTGLLYRGVR